MPPHLVFTQESLRFLSKHAQQYRRSGNRFNLSWIDVVLLLLIAALPLVQLSTRCEMAALLLVYGPMQLLRSIPYDIRIFILTHSRVSLSILQLTSQPALAETRRTEIERLSTTIQSMQPVPAAGDHRQMLYGPMST
ncbi:hypothetical protein [uncultured Caballeronia sp.]|jgi:hypothetical protein